MSVESRRGGGPPSSLRAVLKLVHGVPHQTIMTCLEEIKQKSLFEFLVFSKSNCGPIKMSHAEALRSQSLAADVSLQLPPNTSRNNFAQRKIGRGTGSLP